jgi:hypothetical protein
MEQAATMSSQDVAKLMQSTVQKLSIQLHQLAGLPPWDKPNMINKIKDCWDRCVAAALPVMTLHEGAF